MKRKGHIFFDRLLVTTCIQAHGAPLIDRSTSITDRGRFHGIAILLKPWQRNKYREALPQLALVLGWKHA